MIYIVREIDYLQECVGFLSYVIVLYMSAIAIVSHVC